ncbi:MAG TPA: GAF domain-containing protein [Kribbellaceae bacterium]
MHGQLAREFAEKAARLHSETEFERAAHLLVDLARTSMPCDHAGFLLVHDGVLETIDATDPAVEKADQLELELHEGPALAAIEDPDVERIDDTLADQRWPRWSPAAAALGLRSVLAARLSMPGSVTGALTVYGDEPARFSEETGAVARVLVHHALAMAQATRRRHPGLVTAE